MKNFFEFCSVHYKNNHCLGKEELLNDLKTFKYIKSSFRRYICGNEINTDILINHFIYIFNCFDEKMVDIMFYDFEDYYYPLLKSFFLWMNILPDEINLPHVTIFTNNIPIDRDLYLTLKKIKRNYV